MKLFSTFLKACFAVGLVPVAMALSGCSDNNTTEPNGNTLGATGTLYVTQPGGTPYIYAYNLSTGAANQITHGKYVCSTPQKTIVCWIPVIGLVEYNPVTKENRIIVEHDGLSTNPGDHDVVFESTQVSHDGALIAYQYSNKNQLFIIDRYSGEVLHTIVDKYNPNWTPDGRIVVTDKLGKELYISNSTYTEFEKITTPQGVIFAQPRISPDGIKIAFVHNSHVHTMNLDGSNIKQLTEVDRKEWWPTWSPDSKWIAFFETSSRSQAGLIVLVPLEKTGEVNTKEINSEFFVNTNYQFTWVN